MHACRDNTVVGVANDFATCVAKRLRKTRPDGSSFPDEIAEVALQYAQQTKVDFNDCFTKLYEKAKSK